MLYSDVNQIRKKMNEYGASRNPFLFVVNFELTEGYFIKNPLQQKEIFFSIEGLGNKIKKNRICNKGDLKISPISQEEYQLKFNIVRKGLLRGDSFLTNLTVKTPIQTNCSLEEIIQISDSKFQLFIPGKFVCFSPERFIKISGGCISTYPMKGTINASIPNAKQIILSDFKETAEHNTIVDLLRNDLSIHAHHVHVERFRYVDKIKTKKNEILQVSSEIVGILKSDYLSRLGDIIFDMLPAGSISGAPKMATIRIISEAEQEPRGYYTGVFGYFDGINLDSGVIIRFIELEGDNLFFRSGGGITINSEVENEYQEVLDKVYLPL